jgi:glycosyltransferase involved in cell wall biosynthesis
VARTAQAEIYHILDHSYGTLAATLPSRRTVVTCHDLIPIQIPGIFPTMYSQLTGKRWYVRSIRTMMRAERIIAISESTKRDLVEYTGCSPEKIVVIPHGIDPHFHRIADRVLLEQARQRLQVPSNGRLILHVGSTAAYKNIPAVLEIVRRLSHEVKESVWLIRVGADFTASQKRLVRRLGLEGQVWSTDGPLIQDLVALYNLADVLIFPSLHEGLGLPPIEAMACGLPVVASDVASIREVLADAQTLFSPDDVDGMVEAVVGILSNPELRRRQVDSGLRRARRFSWPLVAEQVFGVYEGLLRNHVD